MTQKDLELIADVLLEARRDIDTVEVPEGQQTARGGFRAGATATHTRIVMDFTKRLHSTNPRFDIDRFLRAAGVK